MSKFFATFFVTVFAVIAVFGVLAMNHGAQNHAAGCVAEKIQGSACPSAEDDALGFVSFHLNLIKKFSAVFSGQLVPNFLVLALAVFGIALFISPSQAPVLSKNSVGFYGFTSASPHPQKERINRWLSLHENSPTDS